MMLETCLYGCDNNVIIIKFPPHCTHDLRPLDTDDTEKCIFISADVITVIYCELHAVTDDIHFAQYVQSGHRMTSNPGRRVTMFEVAAIFVSA